MTAAVGIWILSLSSVLSVSRMTALHRHYSAPFGVYRYLASEIVNSMASDVTVCVGKEWHRFPSHYFLPDQAQIRFTRSEFNGLLPKYFYEPRNGNRDGADMVSKSKRWMSREGTWRIPEGMNDVNQCVIDDRYVGLPVAKIANPSPLTCLGNRSI